MGAQHPILSHLTINDPQWAECSDQTRQHVVEVSTVTADDDLIGVGGSAWPGDLGSTGISVPPAATLAINRRYLFRLCGVEIPSGYAIVLRGIRQLATIRTERVVNDVPSVLEREIESPLWRFVPDGNISWHVRHQQNQFARHRTDPAQIPGTDPMMQALAPALLYNPPLAPYFPLNGGQPPGEAVYGLGTWRDMRFPWTNTEWTLSTLIRGPGSVVMYASVRQPDPSIRPLYPDVDGMRLEDRFVSNFQDTAIYGRVAGSLIFELMPCCTGDGRIFTPESEDTKRL